MDTLRERVKRIRWLAIDVDGTLTDGVYQTSSDGVITKSFYTRDFAALEDFQLCDGRLLMVTQATDPCIVNQLERVKTYWGTEVSLYQGVIDKKEYLDAIIKTLSPEMTWANIAYMGDSKNDLGCMKAAAITGCPADAMDIVKQEANFVSKYAGGHGAVAEFVEYLFELGFEKYPPENTVNAVIGVQNER
jgi:3-deoxy-D-manno-octulosonate 8-phosphate phosphatase (KDO 8-P phosphatase)